MIIIVHRFIIINMFAIIEFYHSGLILGVRTLASAYIHLHYCTGALGIQLWLWILLTNVTFPVLV